MSKTIGIYKVTSNFNTEEAFKLIGASSQIEVCTRDYMSWCKKGKAPKTMQAEFDRVVKEALATEPSATFKVDILKAVETISDLDAAKTEFGLSAKGGKPKTDKPAKTPKAAAPELTPEDALAAMGTLDGTPAPKTAVEIGTEVHQAIEDGKDIDTAIHEAFEQGTAPVDEPVVIGKMGYEAMYREYQGGKSVKDICAENGISKSSFYNNTKQFKA